METSALAGVEHDVYKIKKKRAMRCVPGHQHFTQIPRAQVADPVTYLTVSDAGEAVGGTRKARVRRSVGDGLALLDTCYFLNGTT